MTEFLQVLVALVALAWQQVSLAVLSVMAVAVADSGRQHQVLAVAVVVVLAHKTETLEQ
jgi:hypothetical protein